MAHPPPMHRVSQKASVGIKHMCLVVALLVFFSYIFLYPVQESITEYGGNVRLLGVVPVYHITLSFLLRWLWGLLMFLFLASYLQAVFRSPGTHPSSWPSKDRSQIEWDPSDDEVEEMLPANPPPVPSSSVPRPPRSTTLSAAASTEGTDGGKGERDSGPKRTGWCRQCGYQKPERCHHCPDCDQCVLKYDQHSYWINNCIGFGNEKFFMLSVFYFYILMAFFCVAVLVTGAPFSFGSVSRSSVVVFSIAVCLVVIHRMVALFGPRLLLLALDMTRHESLRFYKPLVQNRYEYHMYHKLHPYDSTFLSINLNKVLGENLFLWLVPIQTKRMDDGLNFVKIGETFENDLLLDGDGQYTASRLQRMKSDFSLTYYARCTLGFAKPLS